MKLSCGVIPVRKNHHAWEFLLLRCYKNWDFPKGMKDEGETPLAAARREFTEETGLKSIKIPSPELFIETEPYSNGKVARYYLGYVEGNEEIRLLPNPVTGILEHHEFRWLTLQEANERLVPRLKKVLEWAEKKLPE
jgi:8-oxo-dGTP pyrophosphatase MutT (NUDIX family)